MRCAPSMFALVTSLACARHAPPSAPHHTPAVTVADATAPRRVMRHREPEAAPPEFAEHSQAIDIDGDGRDDLVRTFPELPPMGRWPATFDQLPPAVVAHRLDDGRYALDDEVTRAALRALCPAPPPSPRVFGDDVPEDEDVYRVPYVEALFLDGFCHRVWGASLDEAVAVVRATARAAPAMIFSPAAVDGVVAALRSAPVPLELEPLDAPALPLLRLVPRPEVPPAVAAVPDPRCAPVLRANDALCARANRAMSRVTTSTSAPMLPPNNNAPTWCVAAAQGLWSIALQGFEIEGGDDQQVRSTGLMTWRPSAPRAAATPAERFEVSARWYTSEEPSLVPAIDYDGDGTPEVFVRRLHWEHEGGSTLNFALYTARDGVIRRYAPAEAFTQVDDVLDADRDGRPDLVLPSPWLVVDGCGMMGVEHAGPSRLAHSLPDGSFSTTDDVARAWTLSRCVRREADADTRPDVLDVACARLGGASPESVVAALLARAPAGPQRETRAVRSGLCLTFQRLAALALVPLPFAPVREGDVPALPDAP